MHLKMVECSDKKKQGKIFSVAKILKIPSMYFYMNVVEYDIKESQSLKRRITFARIIFYEFIGKFNGRRDILIKSRLSIDQI